MVLACIKRMGATMKQSAALVSAVEVSILLALAGCQTEGLTNRGSGGAQGGGGFTQTDGGTLLGGAGGAGNSGNSGGAPGTGGAFGSGGQVTSSGGATGAAGVPGTGGGTAGAGGSSGKLCGGFAGLSCPAGQFCEFVSGTCGKAADAAGVCTSSGAAMCPLLFAPVCGCDGKTYGNDCVRRSAGVSKAGDGACLAAPCPPEISQVDTWPCTEGLTCEYGTDPRPSCRASATCTNNKWVVMMSKCVGLPVATCPATREAAAGQTCTVDGAYCTYADLSCKCTNCSTGGPVSFCNGDMTWHCPAPNTTAGCPAGIPLLGASCTTDSLSCSYGCGAGNARVCKKGAWYSANGGPCPVSTRRAKKNITYLSDTDRQRIAEDLLRFKLATYEYRDPEIAGKRHLGFIIEDVPGSPAVDRDGNMVDLYGYASMMLAAVQAQGEEIARLKAELSRMKLKLRSR